MGRKHVTFGSTGQHEFIVYPTAILNSDRRNRKKCVHYGSEDRFCDKLKIDCMGPSICYNYEERVKRKSNKSMNSSSIKILSNSPIQTGQPRVGKTVYNKISEKGKIVGCNGDECIIDFGGRKVICKYQEALESGFISLTPP